MNITELDSFSLADAVKFHDRLNPRLWGRDEHLLPEVRRHLLAIAADFQESLGVPDLNVEDITISGSNAAYNYTPESDIDLHLVVRMPEQNTEVFQELFNAKKYQYNDEHDIRIGGADVELYVQPADQPHVSQGIYSVRDGKWLQVPRRKQVNIDDTCVIHKTEDLQARIKEAVQSGDLQRMNRLWDKIKDMRKTGLAKQGEFGCDNLVFKMLRRSGDLEQLKNAKLQTRDQELSLREQQPKKPVRYGFGSDTADYKSFFKPGAPKTLPTNTDIQFSKPQDYEWFKQQQAKKQKLTKEDAGETWDGVNPTTCMFLNEEDDNEQVVNEFIQWAAGKLGIKTIPEIFIHTDPDWSVKEHSFGRYEPDTHSLHVNMANRHLFDILRTTAHELAHCKQNEKHKLPAEAGATGSKWENEAHAVAGIIMRDFADAHPELFATPPLSEGKLSRAVAAAAIALAASLVHAQPSQQQPSSTLGALNTALKIYGLSKITAPGVREELTQELKNYIRAQSGDAGAQNQSWVWQQQQQQLQPQQDNPPVRENASGYIPTKKQAKDPRYAMALTVDIKPGEVGRQANKMGLKTDSQGKPGLLMKTVNLRESRNDGNDPLGPEFRPTMPRGTVRVDVSDMYDWYKLGRDFANLDRANPANYGKGPPSTIVSFGDEDAEHKYIKSLQKLGLKTTDIDPKDPNQPAGMPRQSTDPTYNVDEGQVYDFQPNQLIDVVYDPSTVTNHATSQKVATIPYRNLDRLTALLKQKHGIDATKLRWSAAKPDNSQETTEAFDKPYKGKWEHGDESHDMLVKLPDGSNLSIMFSLDYGAYGDEEWTVEFWRNNSQDVTGEGDQQRIFATVLSAIQKFINKYHPERLIFSANKAVEPGQKSMSRTNLYNRLVQRYANSWGYTVDIDDFADTTVYNLYTMNEGVARSLNEFAPGGDEGNSPYAYAIALKEMARLYAEGAFDYDLAPGSKAQNESDAEDISQVADAFMNQGMEAGREAYNMVDTGVRDEMDSYLKDQGFNVQNDIHAEYQKDVERYRNSPQGRAQAQAQAAKDAEYAKGAAARKANEVVISAMDATTGEEEFSKISFDRGSFSPEQLRAKIQRSVAELKQHFVDYPGRNPSEKIIKVTIGGKPVDIDQGVAEGLEQSLSSMVRQDQTERNEYATFVKSQAGGDWSKGAKMYAQLKKRPSNDIFGDAVRLNQFMKMKFDFDKFTNGDWDNYWLLAQHCDNNRDFQKNALSIIKKYQGTDHSHYKYLYDRISMGLTGKQKYGTQNVKEQGVAEDDIVESLRREFELLENEMLGEIKMSPRNLRAEAAKTGAVAGMEFEMIVPEMAGFDDDRDSEPDWDMDESVRDIDDACEFFYDGDFNSRRDIQNLREEMTEQYEEWYDERKKERWEDESADYIRDWLWRTYEDDWSEEAQQEILADTPEFGVNDDELRQRIEDFLKEKWEAATEDVLANMGYDWDQAYDEWSEDFNANNDLEDEWLSDQGWTTMRDIYDNFDIQWPHYYTPDPEGNDINAVADDFSDAVGMPVNASTSYHGGRREPGHYVVEPDSSLEPENANEAGLEFVSPPMPIDKLMDQLKKVKAWAGRYGCYTNESTGLHINISVPDYDLAKLDYVKLALLMGDEYVLDQFGRSSNTYTKSAMGKIRDILRQRPEAAEQVLDRMKGHMADLATKAIHSGSTDKYTSINTKNGYIEFRSPGGDWLDANFDKVENTLLRFTVALSAAMDPQAYRQEYLKKLYKLLSPKNEDDPISYFAKYSAGELPKAALRSFVKQVQLQRRIKRDPTGGQKYWWLVERPGYGASVEVVAASREEAIALGKKEYPEWDYAKDMTAKPLRPYDDSPVKATLGEPQPAGGMRPTNPDGNYVIFANNTRAGDPPAYRFMAADGDDAGIVLRQYSRVNPGDWEVHYDPDQRLGQPPVPGSTLDLQRRRAQQSDPYQSVPIPGVTDVELDIPMAEPRPLGAGRELVGWDLIDQDGDVVDTITGIGNSQADANRYAQQWLARSGRNNIQSLEVVPRWREA